MKSKLAPIVDTGDREWEDLPSMHRTFVERFVQLGDSMQAARDAGFKDDENLKHRARQLRFNLTNHIDEQTKLYVRSTDMTLLGMHTLRDLAERGESETVKLNAAKEILSRSVEDRPKESQVTHNINVRNLNDTDLDKRIEALQSQLQKLGGNVIDVAPG